MSFLQDIYIEEQGLRDGLQSVLFPVSTEQKLRWIEQFVDAGVQRIQLGSFVHPKLVPMMSDTDILFNKIAEKSFSKTMVFSALVLNEKGIQRAIECNVKHLSISLSASNTHSLKNTGKDIKESKIELAKMIKTARQHQIKIRSGIQCAFGCRYEGMISPDVVFDLAKFILDMGVGEISLADSTGMGHPLQIEEMVSILQSMVGFDILTGLHLHNTENKGYANIYAGLRAGCNIIDTAFGGLGGCPFIKEATGNVATEDTVHMLEQMGIDTGIDIQKIGEVSREMATISGESLPGLLYKLPV